MKGFRSLFFGNLLGKVVGALREVLLAASFGTGPVAVAYRVAQTCTLTLVNFFTSDALTSGFLPEQSQRASSSMRRAVAFYKAVQLVMVLVAIIVTTILVLANDVWVGFVAAGLDTSTASLAATMLTVMAVGVPFYISTALASYLEMANGKFLLASIRPTVQSVGLIVGTATAFAFGAPTLLAVGFTGAYVALAVFSSVRLFRLDILTASFGPYEREAFRVFWVRIRPLLIAPFFLQGTWVVERLVASLISQDTVAALDYARFITDTVVVTIAAPLGLALIVSQSQFDARAAEQQLRSLVFRFVAVFFPASTVLAVSAPFLVPLLFQRGAFNDESSRVTIAVLVGLAVGMWAQGLAVLMLRALSARHRNVATSLCIVVGSVVLIGFDLLAYRELGPLALGLGASLGGLAQVIVASILLGVGVDVARATAWNLPHAAIAGLAAFATGDAWPVLLTVAVAALGSLGWAFAARPLRNEVVTLAKTSLRRSA